MTTPTGTIGLSDVNVELGYSSTANITMNDTNVRTLAGVGGNATIISMNDLRGKTWQTLSASLPYYEQAGGYDVNLLEFVYRSSPAYTESYVDIILRNDGTGAYRHGNSFQATTDFTSFTWKTGTGGVGDYYAYVTLSSGALNQGTTGTLLALSTNRSWRVLASGSSIGSYSADAAGTISIRDVNSNVLASRSFSMYCNTEIGT